MAQKTDAQLQTQNDTIQTETVTNANTALRVGTMFEDIIDSKMNNDDLIDEDNMVSDSATRPPSQQSVKAYVDLVGDPAWGNITGTIGNQTDLQTALALKAALAGPTFTGVPAAPTAAAGTSTTQIATTAFAFSVLTNAAVVLTDGATIDLTAIKHTLTTASSRTFTISYGGDDIIIEVTLSATTATQTFPATALCISEGVPTGDNQLSMSGVSGDKYLIAIKKIGSAYYVVCKRFAQ